MNKTKLVFAGMVTLLCLLPAATKVVMTIVYQLQHIPGESVQDSTMMNDTLLLYPEVAPITEMN
ncbi:MAG: hypothetical protein JST86_13690 [Bacteroidetes bacterium]|nr:hypothetical protein [Bacteroidota bacterium]